MRAMCLADCMLGYEIELETHGCQGIFRLLVSTFHHQLFALTCNISRSSDGIMQLSTVVSTPTSDTSVQWGNVFFSHLGP